MLGGRAWRHLGTAAALLLIVGCYVPSPPTPGPEIPNADKLLHGLAFFGIAISWRLGGMSVRRVLLLSLLLIGATEIGQAVLSTGRSAEIADALADLAGVGLGLCAAPRAAPWAVRGRPGQERPSA